MDKKTARKQILQKLFKARPEVLIDEIISIHELLDQALKIPDKGDTGAVGPVGPQGPRGYDGQSIKGERGERGEPGADGHTPIKGVDYRDGLNGRDGREGIPGRDGSPDLPEEIKKKLETLEKPWLDASAIKGVLTTKDVLKLVKDNKTNTIVYPTKNKQDLRWHGGGDTVAAGANVTITTSNGVKTISTAGTAFTQITGTISDLTKLVAPSTITTVVSFGINGQFMHLTTNYTVSGATITYIPALDSSLTGTPFTLVYV